MNAGRQRTASVTAMDAQDWNEKYAGTELVWGAPANAVVMEFATSLPAGRALDLACGEGRNALWLATRGWQVTAVDFSSVALEKGARAAAPLPRSVRERLEWLHADVTKIEFRQEYDLVLVVYLHLSPKERPELLRRAAAALRPGGTLLVLGHDATNIADGVGGPQDIEILYTPTELVDELGDAVDPTVAERRHRHTETGTAIDALVVGRRPYLGS
ncbi:SAM-dependent methyltransferase [Rhodococcus sp. PvR044]|nr:methyltransferase family protein [Rhodococcus sp. OK611]SNX93546.1 Methyltransferase domain-containing protein [Rhodococcus sp. OK270]